MLVCVHTICIYYSRAHTLRKCGLVLWAPALCCAGRRSEAHMRCTLYVYLNDINDDGWGRMAERQARILCDVFLCLRNVSENSGISLVCSAWHVSVFHCCAELHQNCCIEEYFVNRWSHNWQLYNCTLSNILQYSATVGTNQTDNYASVSCSRVRS